MNYGAMGKSCPDRRSADDNTAREAQARILQVTLLKSRPPDKGD